MSLPPPDRNRAETCRRRVRLGDGSCLYQRMREAPSLYVPPNIVFVMHARLCTANLRCPYELNVSHNTWAPPSARVSEKASRQGTILKPKRAGRCPLPGPQGRAGMSAMTLRATDASIAFNGTTHAIHCARSCV